MITRQEYRDDNSKHQAYYVEIALEAGLHIPAAVVFRVRQELADGNEPLNRMPDFTLDAWTALGAACRDGLQKAMKARGDFYSQAGACCAAKALAKHFASKD